MFISVCLKNKGFLKILCNFLFERMELNILVLASIELQIFDPRTS